MTYQPALNALHNKLSKEFTYRHRFKVPSRRRRHYHDVVRSLIAAIRLIKDAELAATVWPIETAPRDGTEIILVFAREAESVVCDGKTYPKERTAYWGRTDWSIPYYRDNQPIGWRRRLAH